MQVLIFNASPNLSGLTAACSTAALQGVDEARSEAEVIRLNDLKISSCQACGNGWGTCLTEHSCQVLDDFQSIHKRTLEVDAYIFITPVYWSDLSESMKSFTDRLRRCEATRGDRSGLANKPIIMVAAAGGSGGGMISCLASLERWIEHVHAIKWDFIPVNRWNQTYKFDTIHSAAAAMVRDMENQ